MNVRKVSAVNPFNSSLIQEIENIMGHMTRYNFWINKADADEQNCLNIGVYLIADVSGVLWYSPLQGYNIYNK